MKKNNIYISIFFLMTLIGFSGCKDDMMEEITTLKVDRTFSPTGLTASVVNKTNALLTWKAVNNAKTYTIEVFENADFSGTAFKTIPNIAITQVPYTVTGLAGDTQYSIRVKGVGEGIDDSKWVTALVKTDPEQIFTAINTAKLTSNSVALNWPAGQTATTITLSPGNITRTVTAAEIAAGEAIVTGLTGETLYTAKLL
ncbi:MAG: fibronectin type III domain-containing protein, partial [Pedobacter sp.]